MGTPTRGEGPEHDGVPRRPRTSLTPDLVTLATRVGRHDWDPAGSGDDEASIARGVLALAITAHADPAAFLQRLAVACLPAGAWAAYGAERLALRLFGPQSSLRCQPAWCALLDRSLALTRTRLLPYPLLPAYLAEHFEVEGGDPEDWLPFSEEPDPEEASITPLGANEVRKVLEGRAGSDVTVTVRLDGAHVVGLVELVVPAGDGQPTGTAVRATVECWRAHHLYDLYIDIAWAFPFRAWADPELEPFFPGPIPRL